MHKLLQILTFSYYSLELIVIGAEKGTTAGPYFKSHLRSPAKPGFPAPSSAKSLP
jgi:hypothetical protein